MSKFQDQREKYLANMEDTLYRQLFHSKDNEEENIQAGQYKPYDFNKWLEEVGRKRGNNILRDYRFSPEEIDLRKVNNPFVKDYETNNGSNQLGRMAGHGVLSYGYAEGLMNNRQFPDEYKRYMNPYEDEVVKKVIEDMRGEKQEGLDSIGSQFTKAGAHGSKILKPNAENKYDRAMEKMIMGEASKLRSSGYQQAAQIFNADRLAREQNIASRMQIPFGMQRFERGQLGTLENLNNASVYDRQQALNSAHGRFREQHDQPFNDISNLHSIFSQGGGYRPTGNYYEASAPQNYFQESKEGGRISLKEVARQMETREPHLAGGGFFKKLLSGKNPVKGFTNFKRSLPDIVGGLGATFGGVGGGALSGAARAAMLKRNILEGALKGGAYGYALPAAAGMAGNMIGNNKVGDFLKDYGASNASNFGSFGTKYLGMEDTPNFINKFAGINPHGQKLPLPEHNPFKALESSGDTDSWTDKLMGKDKGYLDYAAAFAPAAIQGIGMNNARRDAKAERTEALKKEAQEREILMNMLAKEEAKENEKLLLDKPVDEEERAFKIAKMKYEQEKFAKQSALEEKMQKEKEEREAVRKAKELEQERYLEGLKGIKRERPILAFDDGGRVARFAQGGAVSLGTRSMKFASGGYVDGNASGVKDNVRADLPEGSYVLDATTVSLLGDGNSRAGAKKVDEFLNNKRMEGRNSTDTLVVPSIKEARLKKQLASGGELAKVAGRIVPAKISNGEYVLSPEDVLLFSRGGSLAQGAKMLDRMRERLKAQKGVKKGGILPPTKPLEMYLNASY